MAATYDAKLGTDRDWVRFLTGDRGPTFINSDEELDALLVEFPNKYCAAAQSLIGIRDRWVAGSGGITSKSVEGLSISFGSPADLTTRATQLQSKCASITGDRPRLFRVLVPRD